MNFTALTATVSNFAKLWETLRKDADPISRDKPIAISHADIEGLWFRVAYDVPEDWNAEPHPPAGATIANVALVNLKVDSPRTLAVHGRIFRIGPNDGQFAQRHSFHSLATDLAPTADGTASQLYFVTSSAEQEQRLIAGFYTFSNRDNPVDSFFGQYHSDRDGTRRKLAIFGKRVNDDWPIPIGEFNRPDDHTILVKAWAWWQQHYAADRVQSLLSPIDRIRAALE
ncbi:MAG TPA: hypothetical protein VIP11_13410 [Gemmatimonadaceae bacterium]